MNFFHVHSFITYYTNLLYLILRNFCFLSSHHLVVLPFFDPWPPRPCTWRVRNRAVKFGLSDHINHCQALYRLPPCSTLPLKALVTSCNMAASNVSLIVFGRAYANFSCFEFIVSCIQRPSLFYMPTLIHIMKLRVPNALHLINKLIAINHHLLLSCKFNRHSNIKILRISCNLCHLNILFDCLSH